MKTLDSTEDSVEIDSQCLKLKLCFSKQTIDCYSSILFFCSIKVEKASTELKTLFRNEFTEHLYFYTDASLKRQIRYIQLSSYVSLNSDRILLPLFSHLHGKIASNATFDRIAFENVNIAVDRFNSYYAILREFGDIVVNRQRYLSKLSLVTLTLEDFNPFKTNKISENL